jgi:hypothetical protein
VRAAAAVATVVLAAAACRRPPEPRAVDPSLIAVSAEQTVRTDKIGDEGTRATFVLVDADNHAGGELEVVLGGDLIDAAGHVVGPLRREALRIPAGGRRTFALVDDHLAPRPAATAARVTVVRATVPMAPAPVHITDGHVYADQGRAVVAGYVVNTTDIPGKAVILAGFHDAAGRPMTRPYTLYSIGAHARRVAQFVGPPGSTSAYIFVGDVAF